MDVFVFTTKRNIRLVAGLFAGFVALVLATEGALMYTSAKMTDHHRRPYVWITKGMSCILRFVNLGFIINWITAAGKDDLRMMVISFHAILIRTLGILFYAGYFFVKDVLFADSTVSGKYRNYLHHRTPLIDEGPLLMFTTSVIVSIKSVFLMHMYNYQLLLQLKLTEPQQPVQEQPSDPSRKGHEKNQEGSKSSGSAENPEIAGGPQSNRGEAAARKDPAT